jgi:hypothetical protein
MNCRMLGVINVILIIRDLLHPIAENLNVFSTCDVI